MNPLSNLAQYVGGQAGQLRDQFVNYKPAPNTPEERQKQINYAMNMMMGATTGPASKAPLIENAIAQHATRLGQAMEKGYQPNVQDIEPIYNAFRGTLKGSKATIGKIMNKTQLSEMIANLRGMVSPQQAGMLGEHANPQSLPTMASRFTQDALGRFNGSTPRPQPLPFNVNQIKL